MNSTSSTASRKHEQSSSHSDEMSTSVPAGATSLDPSPGRFSALPSAVSPSNTMTGATGVADSTNSSTRPFHADDWAWAHSGPPRASMTWYSVTLVAGTGSSGTANDCRNATSMAVMRCNDVAELSVYKWPSRMATAMRAAPPSLAATAPMSMGTRTDEPSSLHSTASTGTAPSVGDTTEKVRNVSGAKVACVAS